MAGTLTAATIDSGAASTAPVFSANGTQIGTLCRAWVNFNGVTTATVRASFNVSSVTRNSAGSYTVTFTNAMPDVNYAAVATAETRTGGASTGYSLVNANSAQTASATTFVSMAGNATYGGTTDFTYCNVVCFR